jgi:hypothetical protein
MEDRGTIKVIEGNLLERIRQRLPLFLGKRSLSALSSFLNGCYFAQHELNVETESLLRNDFHDWVAYRLHFRKSTLGFANMILEQTPDESQALVRFFELVDEHQARSATTVAKIRRHPEDYKIRRGDVGASGELTLGAEILHANEVSIVVFMDDPGFFVVNNDPSCEHPRRSAFCPSLSWLRKPYRPDPGFTTILDQKQFDRLLREKVAFDQALCEEQEIRQRRVKEQKDKID